MENLEEETIYQLTISYDDDFDDEEELQRELLSSLSEAMNTPNSRKMSSLGLSDISGPGGTPLIFDRVTCDIESLTPVELRKVIDKLKPKLY
jgi:hypothetical protein